MRLLLPATAALCLTMAAIISFVRSDLPDRREAQSPAFARAAGSAG